MVRGSCTSLLGAKASQQMRLLSINRNNIVVVETQSPGKVEAAILKESMLEEFADVFVGEGKLEGHLHLEIDPSVTPVQLPTRKVPIAVKEKLKKELSGLEELCVIKSVNVPTDSISAMVVTVKNDGRIRVCTITHSRETTIRYQP